MLVKQTFFFAAGLVLGVNAYATDPEQLDESDHTRFPVAIAEHTVITSDGSTFPANARIPIYEIGDQVETERHGYGQKDISLNALRSAGVIVDESELSEEEYRSLVDADVYDAAAALDDNDKIAANAERIIGWDTRQRLYTKNYPASSTVLIEYRSRRGARYRCSGTLIGPDTVATAGHCLYRNGWSRNVRVYPGADGASKPFGYCTARTLFTVAGWAYSQNERYDYGAIKLRCNVGNIVGWSGFTTENPFSQAAVIQGYPGDKPLTQWLSADKIRATTSRQVFYRNDTTGGMSGSGVWYDKLGPYLIGIHGYGTHGSIFQWKHRNHNHGVRINRPVFHNLRSWKNF